MAWAKIDDQFADHPKIVAAGALASWLYLAGITYCCRYLTDGFVPEGVVPRLANFGGVAVLTVEGWQPVNVEQLVSALLEHRLWERCDGGYRVHDYLDYNPSAEQVHREREKSANRMAASRDRQGMKPAQCNSATRCGVSYASVAGAPSPSPTPSSTDVEDGAPSGAEGALSARAEGEIACAEDSSKAEATTKRKPRDPNLDHPAVVRYREIAHLTPDETQRAEIVARVTDVERWGDCVRAWVLQGNKKTSIAGILGWYRDGIPEYVRRNLGNDVNQESSRSCVSERRGREEYDNAAAIARI